MKDIEEFCKDNNLDPENMNDVKKAFEMIHAEFKSFKEEVAYVMNQIKNSKIRSNFSEEIKSTYDFIRYIR